MRYKLIVFDYDQTLVQTKESVIKLYSDVARKYYDMDLSYDEVVQYWGLPFPEFLVKALKNKDTFENLSKHYYKEREYLVVPLFDNVIEVIDELITKVDVGLLSSSIRKLIVKDLKKAKFPVDKLCTIQSAEDTVYHKPDPRVFDPIFTMYPHLNREEIIYVGDSMDDYIASSKAGIEFVAIIHNNNTREQFETVKSNIVSDFIELKEFLHSDNN